MKNILFFVLFIFSSSFIHAQFKVTPNGIVTEDDKDFYVIDVDDKNAEELFDLTQAFFIANFRNPNIIINSSSDKSMINAHCRFKDAFVCKSGFGVKIPNDIDMNLIFYFKDNKIRVNAPIINSMHHNASIATVEVKFCKDGFGNYNFLFNKKGKVADVVGVESLTSFVNSIASKFSNHISSPTQSEW